MTKNNIAIIGSGIIGLNLANTLSLKYPKCKVSLIEQSLKLASQASARNSGVLHSGVYYKPNSLQAKLSRNGQRWYLDYCQQKEIPINKCGKIIVLTHEKLEPYYDEIFSRASYNNVNIRQIDYQEAKDLEPLIKPKAKYLWVPDTAVINPSDITTSLIQDLNGRPNLELITNFKVQYVKNNTLYNDTDRIQADHIINCAGAGALDIAHMTNFCRDYEQIPFKGLYVKIKNIKLRRLLYPVPDLTKTFLGIHFTITPNMTIKIGPSALPSFEKFHAPISEQQCLATLIKLGKLITKNPDLMRHNILEFLSINKYILKHRASALVPSLKYSNLDIRLPAGIRNQLIYKDTMKLVPDFIIEGNDKITHVLNIISPGFTTSKVFSDIIANRIEKFIT